MKREFSYKDNFLNYIMSVDEFQSFIENKLLAIPAIYELAGNNELMVSTFKAAFKEIYNSLEMKLNQHYNEKKLIELQKKQLFH